MRSYVLSTGSHRPFWSRMQRAGAVLVLATTLPAVGLPDVPVEAAAPEQSMKTAQDVAAKDLPALMSPAPEPPRLGIPAGDFSHPPSSLVDKAPRGEVASPGRGVKAGATLVGRAGRGEIWDNGDGTSTVVLHARPSVWPDRAGRHRSVDGRLERRGSRLKNTAGPVDFEFPVSSGPGEVATARADDWSLGFSLADR